MTVAEARERLLDLIEQYGGYVGVAIIEADGQLAANREVVSAAAHELVTEPEISQPVTRQTFRRTGFRVAS
jgi:hypothetical protein